MSKVDYYESVVYVYDTVWRFGMVPEYAWWLSEKLLCQKILNIVPKNAELREKQKWSV